MPAPLVFINSHAAKPGTSRHFRVSQDAVDDFRAATELSGHLITNDFGRLEPAGTVGKPIGSHLDAVKVYRRLQRDRAPLPLVGSNSIRKIDGRTGAGAT